MRPRILYLKKKVFAITGAVAVVVGRSGWSWARSGWSWGGVEGGEQVAGEVLVEGGEGGQVAVAEGLLDDRVERFGAFIQVAGGGGGAAGAAVSHHQQCGQRRVGGQVAAEVTAGVGGCRFG